MLFKNSCTIISLFISFLDVENMDGAKNVWELVTLGVAVVTDVINWAGSTLQDVDKLIAKAKTNIEMIEEISDFYNFAESNITSGFYKKLNTVKIELLKLRRELLTLADRTTTHCEKMKVVLSLTWDDEYVNHIMQNQIKQLENLVKDTLVSLKDAKVTYEKLIETWQRIKEDKGIEQFENFLKKLNDIESEEYKTMERKINIAVAGTVTSTLAITITLDVLGCLGICTAVGGT